MRRAILTIPSTLFARLTTIGSRYRRALGLAALLLLVGIALGACTSYDNIRYSIDPNPQPTGTPRAYDNPTPIALVQRDGTPYDTTKLCQGGNWPMDWTKEGIALVMQTLVSAVYMGGYSMFNFVISSNANSPVDVPPVLTAFNIVDYICLPILTLAIVFNAFKIASSGLTGFDYQRSVRAVGKAVVGIILLTPISVGGDRPPEPLLAWAASLPPLVADTFFHALIQQPINTLYQLGGLLTSDKCYFYAAPMVYVGALVIGALMLLLTVALFIKSAVIFLYFVATPLLIAIWPFDELAVFQSQIITGYTVATVSAIPLGIALLIGGQFIVATIGQDALTDIVYMLYVAAFMYIGFKILTTMLGGGVARAMGGARTAAGVATAPARYVVGKAQTAAGLAAGVAAGPAAGAAIGALGQGRFSQGARAGANIARETRTEQRYQQRQAEQTDREAERRSEREARKARATSGEQQGEEGRRTERSAYPTVLQEEGYSAANRPLVGPPPRGSRPPGSPDRDNVANREGRADFGTDGGSQGGTSYGQPSPPRPAPTPATVDYLQDDMSYPPASAPASGFMGHPPPAIGHIESSANNYFDDEEPVAELRRGEEFAAAPSSAPPPLASSRASDTASEEEPAPADALNTPTGPGVAQPPSLAWREPSVPPPAPSSIATSPAEQVDAMSARPPDNGLPFWLSDLPAAATPDWLSVRPEWLTERPEWMSEPPAWLSAPLSTPERQPEWSGTGSPSLPPYQQPPPSAGESARPSYPPPAPSPSAATTPPPVKSAPPVQVSIPPPPAQPPVAGPTTINNQVTGASQAATAPPSQNQLRAAAAAQRAATQSGEGQQPVNRSYTPPPGGGQPPTTPTVRRDERSNEG